MATILVMARVFLAWNLGAAGFPRAAGPLTPAPVASLYKPCGKGFTTLLICPRFSVQNQGADVRPVRRMSP